MGYVGAILYSRPPHGIQLELHEFLNIMRVLCKKCTKRANIVSVRHTTQIRFSGFFWNLILNLHNKRFQENFISVLTWIFTIFSKTCELSQYRARSSKCTQSYF